MRSQLFRFWLVVIAMLMVSPAASAISLRMIPTSGDPTWLIPGESFTVALVLDTEGTIGIESFSVGLTFDPEVITYNVGESDLTDWVLYTWNGGKTPTWLEPTHEPPLYSPTALYPMYAQLNLAFIEPNLRSTDVAGDGIVLGHLRFDQRPNQMGEVSPLLLGFFGGGTHFLVDGADVSDEVSLNEFFVLIAPEPGTALLVGAGLFGLGAAARRRSKRPGRPPAP